MKHTWLAELPQEAVSHNPAICKQVMLHRGEVPHLTQFAQARFAPGQVAPSHAHTDMAEVFFVESGQGVITINGREHSLQPGVCVVVEAGELHEVANRGSEELVLTYLGLQL